MSNEPEVVSRKEYEDLKTAYEEVLQANEDLAKQVQQLVEQLALMKKQRFGSSSEKTVPSDIGEQLGMLFNEAEVTADMEKESLEEPDLTTVKEHKRTRRRITHDADLPEDVEVEVSHKRLEGDALNCPECGEPMVEIGEDVIRRLKLIPAHAVIEEIHIHSYKCPNCTIEDEKEVVVSAKADPAVIPGSNATAEAVAFVADEKFEMYSPLYRIEQMLNRRGIPLSRETMSNWLIEACRRWLKPIRELMIVLLLEEGILHADETTLQVLHEEGRKAQTKSYMWLYRTGRYATQQLVLYEYQETRNSEHPKNFLLGYKGYLHTDGYQGYHSLPKDIRIVGCLAHARRKFIEALAALKEEDRKGTAAERGVRYFDTLFALEEKWHDLDSEERKQKRLEFAKPILDELHDWVFRLNVSTKSLLGKAAHYTRAQWPYLIAYLEDGRLECSNNRAERSIKPFVMARKNFLFANTPSGAEMSAIYFSLIETAKENGLDPYKYLVWVFKTAPTLDMSDCDQVETLLPMHAPDSCRSKKRDPEKETN